MPRLVIHNNDGHVDDLLSGLLLWLSPEVDLQAISLTNGDCFADQSFAALLKIATYLDLEGAEIAYNDDPIPNPFPENWRRESYIMNELPIFRGNALKKPYQQGRGRKSQAVIIDCLSHSKLPFTLVSTGPLTPFAQVLEARPDLKGKIEEFVIMGGAINVPGNVDEENGQGAEWNLYADPPAAKAVLDSGVPIRLVPLDLTNQLPVTQQFLDKLEQQSEQYKASRLALKLWSLVKGFDYFFWDTVTAALVIEPSLFTFKDLRLDLSTQGRTQGKLSTMILGGRKIKVARSVQKDDFEELLLSILRLK